MAKLLVTGGAGYIGSHTTRQLVNAGHEVVVVDNLYSGHRWAIADQATFVEANIADKRALREVFGNHHFSAVIHFAGHIVVPESVSNPAKYYHNNVVASQRLLECCQEFSVNRFLFSSSAAVYGIPNQVPVNEQAATEPINPYGRTKLITEWSLADLSNANGADPNAKEFNYLALRYFNVAGAAIDGLLGQATPEATHLIKVACEAACGLRDSVSIFGNDYDTADGTCVRDYIHVEDLAAAHVTGLQYLLDGGRSEVMNCGYGHGYSVKEVLGAVQKQSGVKFKINQDGRRAGDPPALIANNQHIRAVLGWIPQYDDLNLICNSAYQWEVSRPSTLSKNRSHKLASAQI